MQHSTSSVALRLPEWLTRLHDNCLQAIPTRYIQEPSSLLRPLNADTDNQCQPCHMQTTNNEAVTLQSVALPDLICTATTAIAPEQTIAALPLGHPWLSLITPTRARSAGFHSNAIIKSPCPNSPVSMCIVTALQHIGPDEVILACPIDDTQNQPSIQIVGQFDGSSQREERIGGAGYVVYAIEGGQSRVIACRAVALPRCSDNIEAEILACLFPVEEVSIVVKQLLAQHRRDPANFNRDAGPVSIRPAFPMTLFQAEGFHIQCFEQPWVHPVLALVERPFIDHGLLRRHLTLHPYHRQLIESYLSPCMPQCSSTENWVLPQRI